jgi:mono/diheme cytochrome c family protein
VPDGHLYLVITNGIRNMPSYRSQISVEDRWAIVAYIRALQRSQHASVADVPESMRRELQVKQ